MKFVVLVFPLLALSLIYIFRDNLIILGSNLPACPSRTYLDIYCPGCGNTRSVQHLLKGDILGALRFNPVPIIGIVIGIFAYIELITYIFGKHKKLLPRNRKVWIVFTFIMILYFIARNFIYVNLL